VTVPSFFRPELNVVIIVIVPVCCVFPKRTGENDNRHYQHNLNNLIACPCHAFHPLMLIISVLYIPRAKSQYFTS